MERNSILYSNQVPILAPSLNPDRQQKLPLRSDVARLLRGLTQQERRLVVRKILVASMLFAIITSARSQANDEPPVLQQPQIRLPSITTKWKRPGESDGPEISIEELARCMGQDVSMQGEINELKLQQSRMKAGHATLFKGADVLSEDFKSLEASRKALKEQAERFQAQSTELRRQASFLDQKKSVANRTPSAVREINALVSAYNTAAAKHNKWRSALLKEQDNLGDAISAYNVRVAQLNQDALAFNQQNAEFQERAANLTGKSSEYVSQCSGERVLRK